MSVDVRSLLQSWLFAEVRLTSQRIMKLFKVTFDFSAVISKEEGSGYYYITKYSTSAAIVEVAFHSP